MSTPRVSPRPGRFTLLLAAFFGATTMAVAADDAPRWPQFHGPNRDNRSTETGLLDQWPEGGPQLAWKVGGLGHGYSSLAIADGRIYTAGNIDGKTMVIALDMSGSPLWQAENGPAWIKPVPGARATPTFDDGRIYHESPHGDIVCLDAATGQRIWGFNILERFQGKNLTWAVSESLLIDGAHLICKPGGAQTTVVALDKATGETVWKSPSCGDEPGYASCTLAERHGLRIILTLTSKALIGVNADTGDLLFRHLHETPFDENISMPIFHDGHVFISTRTVGSELLRLHVDGAKASLSPVWKTRQLDNQHGGVILDKGYLYGACHIQNRARWVCLNWASGEQMYAADGVGKGSSTYADGKLFILSEKEKERHVALVPVTPTGHVVSSRFQLPEGGRGPTWAHPVVCDGRLYIRHGEMLFVYEVR